MKMRTKVIAGLAADIEIAGIGGHENNVCVERGQAGAFAERSYITGEGLALRRGEGLGMAEDALEKHIWCCCLWLLE
jgi:hypothetical protein